MFTITIIDWRNIRLHIQNILTVLYVEEGGGMGGGGGGDGGGGGGYKEKYFIG